jgi:SPP1 gp7 family putative phage head morphogenesis protein
VSSRLEQALARNRAELAAREADAFRTLTRAYTDAYRRTSSDLERLMDRVEQARLAGTATSPAWLYQERRYLTLITELGRQLEEAAAVTRDVVTGEQRAAIELAQRHSLGLVDAELGTAPDGVTAIAGSWARLNTSAVEQALGYQAAGSPLRTLLDGLAPDGVRQIGGAIVTGIATGKSPRETARIVSNAFGVNASRSLTIARTETMRAYRESSRQAYLANPAVVTGWTWVSALDRRTCACCYALHGSTHKADEQLDGHPSCRCVMAPITPTWKELLGNAGSGITDTRVKLETGPARFAKLDPEVQRQILGPGKHRLYVQGKLELRDVVQRSRSRAWGTMRREASIRRSLDNAARRSQRVAQRVSRGVSPRARAGATHGPLTRQEWERAAEKRVKEIDGKWSKFVDQLAPLFANMRGETAFRNVENAKARRQQAGITKSGRLSGSRGRKSTVRKTVTAELREAGERAALQFMADHPDEAIVKHVAGLLEEADTLREQLEALRDSGVGFLGHDFA